METQLKTTIKSEPITLILPNSCRFCLTTCNESELRYTSEQAFLYEICTGVHLSNSRLAVKICKICNAFFRRFKRYQERAAEIEQQLQLAVSTCEVKVSTGQLNGLVHNSDDEKYLQNIEDITIKLEPDLDFIPPLNGLEFLHENGDEPSVLEALQDVKVEVKQLPIILEKPKKECIRNNRKTREQARRRRKKEREFNNQPKMCSDCGQEFPSQGKLKLHILYKHSKDEVVCHLCGKSYKQQCKLQFHFERSHAKEFDFGTYYCDFCGKQFNSRLQIVLHLRNHHRLFECKECGRQWWHRASLLRHRQAHHQSDKEYPCNECNKVFATYRYLTQHKKVHDNSRYVCPLCPGTTFSFTTTLKAHMASQHPSIIMPPSGTMLKNFNWNEYLKGFL